MMDRDRELHEMADEGRALMSDYIKRTDALDIVADNNVTGEITLNRYDKIIDGIYEIPSADVAPVRHGRFVPFEDVFLDTCWECSECGLQFYLADGGTPKENRYNYCPNCGAKMDEEK